MPGFGVEPIYLVVLEVGHLAVDVSGLPKGHSLDGSIRARVEEGGPGRPLRRGGRGRGRGGGGRELQPEVALIAGIEKVAVWPCNMNIRIKTEPVTAGADATEFVRLLFTNIWPRIQTYTAVIAPTVTGSVLCGQCIKTAFRLQYSLCSAVTYFKVDLRNVHP